MNRCRSGQYVRVAPGRHLPGEAPSQLFRETDSLMPHDPEERRDRRYLRYPRSGGLQGTPEVMSTSAILMTRPNLILVNPAHHRALLAEVQIVAQEK